MSTTITVVNGDAPGRLSGAFDSQTYPNTLKHINMEHSQQRIKDRFDTYEGAYNLVFFNLLNKEDLGNIHFEKKIFPEYLIKDKANIIFRTNHGVNSLPFTPWITTHRMIHAFQSCFPTQLYNYGTNGIDHLLKDLNELAKHGIAWNMHPGPHPYDALNNSMWHRDRNLMSYIFKGRSGRDNALRNDLDFLPEVFTYYMFYKKVEFNRISEEFIPEERRILRVVKETLAKVNDRLSYYEEEITKEMKKVSEDILGKTLIF